MTKMKCEKCGSENIQMVTESRMTSTYYIQGIENGVLHTMHNDDEIHDAHNTFFECMDCLAIQSDIAKYNLDTEY